MIVVPYILGLVGVLLSSIIVVAISHSTGFDISSLSLFVIIPVGGIIMGLAGAGLFYLGKKITSSKVYKIDYLIGALLGLMAFMGVNYISYKIIYVSEDTGEVVESLNKKEGFIALSEEVSFFDYMKMINSSSTMQMRRGIEIEMGEFETNALFYIQLLGALGAGVFMVLAIGSIKYCDNCNKYYKSKILKQIDIEKIKEDIEKINNSLGNVTSFRQCMDNIKEKEAKATRYGELELFYCPFCYESYLELKFYQLNSKGEAKEVPEFKQTILLKQSITEEII